MQIRLVGYDDIAKWKLLSSEYDGYVKELVSNLTEWYDGNDTSPAFDSYMESKIGKSEAIMVVDSNDDCLGIAAFSKANNRITFFGVSNKSDFKMVGSALLEHVLSSLNKFEPVYINEIISGSVWINKHIELFQSFGFAYSCDSTENGVPVNTYVKLPSSL